MNTEKKISPQLAYYQRKRQDPEFYKKELIRINEMNKNRYRNDEEYRNKVKENSHQRYLKIKELSKDHIS